MSKLHCSEHWKSTQQPVKTSFLPHPVPSSLQFHVQFRCCTMVARNSSAEPLPEMEFELWQDPNSLLVPNGFGSSHLSGDLRAKAKRLHLVISTSLGSKIDWRCLTKIPTE